MRLYPRRMMDGPLTAKSGKSTEVLTNAEGFSSPESSTPSAASPAASYGDISSPSWLMTMMRLCMSTSDRQSERSTNRSGVGIRLWYILLHKGTFATTWISDATRLQ